MLAVSVGAAHREGVVVCVWYVLGV
jgi:hypothetical protein